MYTTSHTLLEKVKANEEGAWERFVQVYTPLFHSWLVHSRIGIESREDLCQEICLTVYKGLGKFRVDGEAHSFRRWLRTVARTRVVDFIRASSPTVDVDLALIAFPEHPGIDEEESNYRILANQAFEILKTEASALDFKAFWETAVMGRDITEVMAQLGMNRNKVAIAKSRLTKKWKEMLVEWDPDLFQPKSDGTP